MKQVSQYYKHVHKKLMQLYRGIKWHVSWDASLKSLDIKWKKNYNLHKLFKAFFKEKKLFKKINL